MRRHWKSLVVLAAVAAAFTLSVGPVLAQGTAAPAAPASAGLWAVFGEVLIRNVLPPVAGAIGLLLVALLSLATAKLKTSADKDREQNKRLTFAIAGEKALHFATVIVSDLQATMRSELEKVAADGKITKEEASELKRIALDRLVKVIGEEGKKELVEVLGIAGSSLEVYLSGLIEQALDLVKVRGAAVGGATGTSSSALSPAPAPVVAEKTTTLSGAPVPAARP